MKLISALFLTAVLSAANASTTEEATVFTGDEGVRLAGTFSMPAKPRAAAVLLSIAGPTDRDLQFGPKSFFRPLAEELAVQGIATLRFDDRGIGESGGNWQESTFVNRAKDACGAMEHLRLRFPDLDQIGYVGMSEGGGLAIYAHVDCSPGNFIVLLSTPMLAGKDLLRGQFESAVSHMTALDRAKRKELLADGRRFIELLSDTGNHESWSALRELMAGPTGGLLLPPYYFVPQGLEARIEFLRSPWYQSQVGYDISAEIGRIAVPVLAIYGALDRALDPKANARLARKQLGRQAEVRVERGLNHLLQEARTGSPMEYLQLPGSISTIVVRSVTNWIAAR